MVRLSLQMPLAGEPPCQCTRCRWFHICKRTSKLMMVLPCNQDLSSTSVFVAVFSAAEVRSGFLLVILNVLAVCSFRVTAFHQVRVLFVGMGGEACLCQRVGCFFQAFEGLDPVQLLYIYICIYIYICYTPPKTYLLDNFTGFCNSMIW